MGFRRNTAVVVAIGATLAALGGCTKSGLRYRTTHVAVANDASSDAGADIYGVEDELGIARMIPQSRVVHPGAEGPTIVELRSWQLVPSKPSAVALFVRDGGSAQHVETLTTPDGCLAARQTLANAVAAQLLDAGMRVERQITIAFVEDDLALAEAGADFEAALSTASSGSEGGALKRAREKWSHVLNHRTADREAVMAAAFDLAVAQKLGVSPEEADVFTSISVLHAKTQALALDVVRLMGQTPDGLFRDAWKLPLAVATGEAAKYACTVWVTESDLTGASNPELGAMVARAYYLRPAEAARALREAGRRAWRGGWYDPIRAATATFYRAAALLYARDNCAGTKAQSATDAGKCRESADLALKGSCR